MDFVICRIHWSLLFLQYACCIACDCCHGRYNAIHCQDVFRRLLRWKVLCCNRKGLVCALQDSRGKQVAVCMTQTAQPCLTSRRASTTQYVAPSLHPFLRVFRLLLSPAPDCSGFVILQDLLNWNGTVCNGPNTTDWIGVTCKGGRVTGLALIRYWTMLSGLAPSCAATSCKPYSTWTSVT